MKRRTIDSGKSRRPIGIKKTKISDGVYNSTLLYVKFLFIWALIMVADFIVEFRFEYLWPLWLLFRSAFDSFRYQGIMFCVLFCCVSIASDIICYIFMPAQWLYVVASTYVWVQYVWHTDRGICLPTVSLWILFVYIETSLRLRGFKCLPFQIDLCRPFAAHCIGYPVVTLGFGFKSYVSYKLRLRKQKEVQKENELYFQLLQQALPAEQLNNNTQQQQQNHEQHCNGKLTTGKSDETNFIQLPSTTISSLNTNDYSGRKSSTTISSNNLNDYNSNTTIITTTTTSSGNTLSSSSSTSCINGTLHTNSTTNHHHHHRDTSKTSDHNFVTTTTMTSLHHHSTTTATSTTTSNLLDGGDYAEAGMVCNRVGSSSSMNNFKEDMASIESNVKVQRLTTRNNVQLSFSMKDNSSAGKKFKQNNLYRDDHILSKLEQDVKKAKAELQSSRNVEQELRGQINSLLASDKSIKLEINLLRQDNENLQIKLQNLVSSRQQDKQTLANLEKKLQEEKRLKSNMEQLLQEEKKKKIDLEANRQQELSDNQANLHKEDCADVCSSKRAEVEKDLKLIGWEVKKRDEQISKLEHEIQVLQQCKDAQNDTEVLMSALLAMQEKNSHLENNLSAETRLKMDLFSALGDAKRQIEIQHSMLLQKDAEINELQTKVAEVMALVPSTSGFGALCHGSQPHFSAAFTSPNYIGSDTVPTKSNLNPNATDYQPKTPM